MEYFESYAYGKVCETAFGIDLKQMGMMTKTELDLLLDELKISETDKILEVGCGAGQVAAYISDKTFANVTGIDINEKASLRYHVLDYRNVSELKEKYNKIMAIDSLYFVSDMDIETFFVKLKETIAALYELLESGGSLAVFWSELPFFKPERKSPECTQLGICLNDLKYSYRTIDFTNNEVTFWKNFKDALMQYENDFINEDSKDLFDSNIGEAEFFIEGAKKERLYRNLYIVDKI